MKKLIKLLGFTVLVALIGFSMVTCDNDTTSSVDPQAAYYHSWKFDPDPSTTFLITITADTFVFEVSSDPGAGFSISSLTWTPISGGDNYPTGYKLTGTLTASTGGYMAWDEDNGDNTSTIGATVVYAIYINTNRNSIKTLIIPDDGYIYASGPYIKQ